MANEQDTSRGIDLLAEALKEKTCKDVYGLHTWVKHEETLQDYCKHCLTRKDVWEQKKPTVALSNAEKMPERDLSKVPEHLREYVIKPGEVKNPNGRPKGSKNLTTIVMEALKAKVYTVKNESTGQTTEITGEQAFAEAVLENAIKKKDRESLRMIWEMADGKPTQQHKLEFNGPKGYQVDPQRENVIHEQFGMYAFDRVGPMELPEPGKTTPVSVETQETAQTPDKATIEAPRAEEAAKTGVSEPQPTHANSTEQPTGGVQSAQTGNTGGVKEA